MALLMLAQQRKIPALVFGEQKSIIAFISLIVYIFLIITIQILLWCLMMVCTIIIYQSKLAKILNLNN